MKNIGKKTPGSSIHKLYDLRSPNSQPSELGNLTLSKMQQLGSMPNLKFQTLLNKNPPIVVTVQEYDFSGVVLGGRIILSIFTQIRMILLMEMRYKRARVKTLDSLISSLQIPRGTGIIILGDFGRA